MAHETPNHIKLGNLAGALLLLPFFAALIANGLNKVFYGHDLYNSWLWRTPVLFTWVILLPALAFVVGAATFLAWSAGRRKQGPTSSWKLLSDWHHTWPMLAVLVVSLGILGMVRFHDSVHCVTGNPVREIHNPRATWRCISDN